MTSNKSPDNNLYFYGESSADRRIAEPTYSSRLSLCFNIIIEKIKKATEQIKSKTEGFWIVFTYLHMK